MDQEREQLLVELRRLEWAKELSVEHDLPRPSPRYAAVARSLRKLGLDVESNEYDLIDEFCNQLRTVRHDHPKMPRHDQRLLAQKKAAQVLITRELSVLSESAELS